MKQKPSLITSPPVTLDEIARTFKISKKRRKELEQLALKIEAKMAPKAKSKSRPRSISATKGRQNPAR